MLLDHFHSPLADHFGWQGFHTQWAAVIAADLNERLPPGWRAEPELEFGIKIDVGVVEYEDSQQENPSKHVDWQPPSPTLTIPFLFTTDRLEIRVYNYGYGPSLMGAIELVSPANKDRPENRDAFALKSMSILNEGAGMIVVDIVTKRNANLHDELLTRLGQPTSDAHGDLYTSAYAPKGKDDQIENLRVWYEQLAVGRPLPVMPLHLRVGPTMPLDLNTTYLRACNDLRIKNSANGN